MERITKLTLALLLAFVAPQPARADDTQRLTIGVTYTLDSRALGETRRVNVYTPPGYDEPNTPPLPVLYLLDGGIKEDFLHIAGLVQVSTSNGTMRPFLLVGVENTERRRDFTGPTTNDEDKKIAPRVGGSAAFRKFLSDELMPDIRKRFRTTDETAIIGESLAGLFIVETLFERPDLFDAYIAIDPSLWWNNQALIKAAPDWTKAHKKAKATLFLAGSDPNGNGAHVEQMAKALKSDTPPNLRVVYEPMPGEQHQTIFHPAALKAVRLLFRPPAP